MYLREGFIVQADGDYGDTAHRHGWLETADQLCNRLQLPHVPIDRKGLVSYTEAVQRLKLTTEPQRSPWGNGHAGEFSRDQMIPNLCAMKLLHQLGSLDDIRMLTYTKWGNPLLPKLPNGDIATAQVFNLLDDKATRGGLLELLANSIICSLKMRINSDDSDMTLNTFCMFATLYALNPNSLILKSCRLVFKYLHPGVDKAIRSYFRPQMGGNIELAAVWSPVIEKLLK